MRPTVLLAALLVVGAAFAGCVGQTADQDPAPASTGDGDPGTNPDGTPAEPGSLKVLAPLMSTVSFEGPAWVAPGAKVPVSATAPAQAKGEVAYTWAIGPLPGTVKVDTAGLDTKLIDPGATGKLTFEKAGVYNMHCHPHPFMLSNVTVVDGYAGPSEVTVVITDGSDLSQSRFIPERVFIPVGGTVVYRNEGTQPHTATQSGQEPELKALDLKAASGEATVSGDGWQRLVLLTKDSDGRVGQTEKPIYVKALPEDFSDEFSGEFTLGVPGAAPEEGQTEVGEYKFKLAYAGAMTLNFTAVDAPGEAGSPVGLAQVEIHLKEDGATQDTLTSDPKSEGSLTGRVNAKSYDLTVIPRQGAAGSYTVVVTVAYDLVPPEPVDATAAGAGGHEGHGGGGGGHAH